MKNRLKETTKPIAESQQRGPHSEEWRFRPIEDAVLIRERKVRRVNAITDLYSPRSGDQDRTLRHIECNNNAYIASGGENLSVDSLEERGAYGGTSGCTLFFRTRSPRSATGFFQEGIIKEEKGIVEKTSAGTQRRKT